MRIDNSSIRVNPNTCIACGICVDRCIMDNLRLSVAPCRQACPLDMNCQGYVRLIAMGKESEAIRQLMVYGPFLKIIADTCDAPCEKACVRKKDNGAVAILELKRYLAKKYADQINTIIPPEKDSGKSVAIVGADSAGLACAMRARQAGHAVIVFTMPGDTKLPAIIDSLQAVGVTFKEAESINPNDFDAAIICRTEFAHKLGLTVSSVKAPSHFTGESVFCVDSGKMGKGTVHALAEAFETMASVERFFANEPLDWGRGLYSQGGAVKQFKTDTRVGSSAPRVVPDDTKYIYDEQTAREQAARCHSCGRAFEKNQTCWYCLPCELECPQQALEVRIPYLVR